MNFLFALLVCLLCASLVTLTVRARKVRAKSPEWDVLVSRLASVDRDAIARIALTLREDSLDIADDECRVWFDEAGWIGLENLEKNCAVMIEMARHLQSRYPEAIVIAEQLRLSARQLEWHVSRVRLASQAGHLEACFEEYGKRAIGMYYDMTQTLKLLYRELSLHEWEQLEAVL